MTPDPNEAVIEAVRNAPCLAHLGQLHCDTGNTVHPECAVAAVDAARADAGWIPPWMVAVAMTDTDRGWVVSNDDEDAGLYRLAAPADTNRHDR